MYELNISKPMKRAILAIHPILAILTAPIAQARSYQPVSFTHEGLSVDARLTLPTTPPPYRIIILNPGSGANDKDGTIEMTGGNVACLYPGLYGTTLTPYKGLSDALADSGFAVLTYDKLEYSYPTGLGAITFEKLWLPVNSAIEYLKTRSDIDTGNMVLLGHSEGSTLIPYIARKHPGVKALISLAGPRTSAYDTLLAYQLLYITRTCAGDTVGAKNQGAQIIAYFNLIRSGGWNASTPNLFGVPASEWSDYVHVSDSVAINYNLSARKTLFVGLGSDINVPISTELTRFRTDITVPADFYEIPGLNHYLSTATDPSVSQVLTDTLVYWLRRNTPPLSTKELTLNQPGNFEVSASSGLVRINASEETLREIAVFDMSGHCIYKAKAEGHTLQFNLSAAPGIYTVSITGNKTKRVTKLQL